MRNQQRRSYQIPLNYSLPKAILDLLIDFGENSVLFEDPFKRLDRAVRGYPRPKRWRYNRAMRYLEHLEHIELVTRNDRLFVRLTQKGKVKALLARLESDFKKSNKWDGKWRVVIWDIPEDSKEQRNRIRQLVKDLGFFQLQKSVFITPHSLPSSAVAYLRECELLRFIRFLRVDKIDDDQYLKKHFKLS